MHPRHAPFYTKVLGFEVVGKEEEYGEVNNNLAVPIMMDLESEESRRYFYEGFK